MKKDKIKLPGTAQNKKPVIIFKKDSSSKWHITEPGEIKKIVVFKKK